MSVQEDVVERIRREEVDEDVDGGTDGGNHAVLDGMDDQLAEQGFSLTE